MAVDASGEPSGARAKAQKRSRRAVRLLKYTELEEWRKDNEWILTGLCYVHNETGNVYSHLVGALVFIGLAAYTYVEPLADALMWDKLIFGFFLVSAVSCLGISGLFHLFCSHSESTAAVWNRGDYLGITVLIVGSASPSIYYSFHCEPYLQVAYLSLMLVLGAATVPFIMLPRFSTPTYRVFRAWLYVLLGCSGVVPTLHSVYMLGLEEAARAGALEHMLAMGACYLIGAWLYAVRLPERRYPGRFDYWLHSHQIFHLCVFAAALVHYAGLYTAFMWHRENPCSVRSRLTAQLVRMASEASAHAKEFFFEPNVWLEQCYDVMM